MEMCQNHVALSNDVATLKAKTENLEEYRDKQNGALLRLTEQMEDMRRWLTGLLGGMVVSLILLVANLVITYAGRR